MPPGDPALTRRVKAAGGHWAVHEKRGRKVFSRGVWAAAATAERIGAELAVERSTERFANRKRADALHRPVAAYPSNPLAPVRARTLPGRLSAGRGTDPRAANGLTA